MSKNVVRTTEELLLASRQVGSKAAHAFYELVLMVMNGNVDVGEKMKGNACLMQKKETKDAVPEPNTP